MASAPRRFRASGRPQGKRARGAVRRSRARATQDQGSLPLVRGGTTGAPRVGHRHRRHRQVAAGVGVREVHRRRGARRLLAPWPLPLLRRRCHLLGAGGHGAHALPHRRGGAICVGVVEAAGDARRASARCGRAGLRGAAAGPAAGSRRAGAGRQAGAVRGLAAVLRASRGRVPDGARVRGRAVGGRVAARLRRVPAGVGALEPALRAHPGPTGTARAPADLGRRPPQLRLAVRGAAGDRGDGGAARGSRTRPARGAARPDPLARRGRAAVRGGDGADAARPRTARPGRSRLPAHRRDRGARRAQRHCTP